jgi:arylsulfatase A-like enzyme
LLKDRGVSTCLLIDASHPGPEEFSQGWDAVEQVQPAEEEETPLEAMIRAASERLAALDDRQHALVWLDLATLVPPWQVPVDFEELYFEEEPPDSEEDEEEEVALEPLTPLPDPPAGRIDEEDDTLFLRIQGSYAAAVSYLDAGLGQLLEEVGDDVCVVVTSDCGQNLSEHGLVGSLRPWLHEEVLHLPLILRLPQGERAGRRISALTQAVDLAPTLASLFDLTLPDAHGHNLLPLLRGQIESIRPYALGGLQIGDGIEWAVRSPDWVFLYPVQPHAEDSRRSRQLYVKPDDRCEVNNVVQHHLDLADQLEQLLRSVVAASQQPGPRALPPLPEG